MPTGVWEIDGLPDVSVAEPYSNCGQDLNSSFISDLVKVPHFQKQSLNITEILMARKLNFQSTYPNYMT